jgi:hypothetical protein
MTEQTARAIEGLQRLLPSMAVIHRPRVERAIDALLRSVEALQVAELRIAMLELRERAQVHTNATEWEVVNMTEVGA